MSNQHGQFALSVGAANAPDLLVLADGYLPILASPSGVPDGAAFDVPLTPRCTRGRVLDPSGRPIAGATVQLLELGTRDERRMTPPSFGAAPSNDALPAEPARDRTDGAGPIQAVTGADGRFSLTRVQPGTYLALASAEGHVQGVLEARVPLLSSLELPAIRLASGAEVHGVVIAADGRPIGGARVAALSTALPTSLETHTAEDGTFRFAALLGDASTAIVVRAAGFVDAEQAIAPPGRLDFTLEPLPTVSGQVREAGSGRPVPHFRLTLLPEAGPARSAEPPAPLSSSSPDGRFTWPGVPPGSWTLRVEAHGFVSSQLHGVHVIPGEDTEVEIGLERGTIVVGVVVEALTDAPVAGAVVGGRAVGDTADRETTTSDRDGRFVLTNLPPTAVAITAGHAEFLSTTERLAAASGERGLRVSLTRGGVLGGVVVAGADRRPRSGALVYRRSPGGGGQERVVRTASDGTFELRGVPGGTSLLQAEHAGLLTSETTVHLVAGERRDGLELVLRPGARLQGRLLGIDESAAATAWVTVAGGGHGGSARLNGDGTFAVDEVQPGRNEITAGVADGRRVSRQLTVEEGVRELWVELELPAGGTLSGRVTRGTRPLAKVTVHAAPTTSGTASTVLTDAVGVFRLTGLPPGEYLLTVDESWRQRATVAGDTWLDLALPEASGDR